MWAVAPLGRDLAAWPAPRPEVKAQGNSASQRRETYLRRSSKVCCGYLKPGSPYRGLSLPGTNPMTEPRFLAPICQVRTLGRPPPKLRPWPGSCVKCIHPTPCSLFTFKATPKVRTGGPLTFPGQKSTPGTANCPGRWDPGRKCHSW